MSVSAEAQAQLLAYAWPGNVRELENVVQRALVLCQGECIEPAHLMFDDLHLMQDLGVNQAKPANPQVLARPAEPLPALVDTAWQSPAAADLGTSAHPASLGEQHAAPLAAAPFAELAAQMRALPAANLQAAVKSNELQMILAAIQSTDSRIEAAKKLGISPRTLRYKLAKFKAEPSALDPAANASAINPAAAPLAFAMAG